MTFLIQIKQRQAVASSRCAICAICGCSPLKLLRSQRCQWWWHHEWWCVPPRVVVPPRQPRVPVPLRPKPMMVKPVKPTISKNFIKKGVQPTSRNSSDSSSTSWNSTETWQDESMDPEDWKDWKNSSNSSDLSSDWRDWTSEDGMWNSWTSWNSDEKWIQDKRYQEKEIEIEGSHTGMKQMASWEKEPSGADSDMELDLVSGKKASTQYQIGQWCSWVQKWEDEKTELTLFETYSQEAMDDEDHEPVQQTLEEFEVIREEDHDDHEEMIKQSRKVLQRYCRQPLAHRSSKQGRSPSPPLRSPNPPIHRSGKQGKRMRSPLRPLLQKLSRRQRAKAKREMKRKSCSRFVDDKRELSEVNVEELRYSQMTCSETFSYGQSVMQLVQDLVDQKVSLSDPFLRLNVFETTDEKTNQPILRCINNRRLYALKEFAKKSRGPVMVNISLFSQDTIQQVFNFLRNSDQTDGKQIRLRKNQNMYRENGQKKQRHQPFI